MDKLKFISDQMAAIGVNYEFIAWTSEPKYPYFVGDITELPVTTADGKHESTMLLSGFTRGDILDLEIAKNKIKAHFHPLHGLHGQTAGGAIVVFYDGAQYIPTGEAELYRVEMTIKILEGRVT